MKALLKSSAAIVSAAQAGYNMGAPHLMLNGRPVKVGERCTIGDDDRLFEIAGFDNGNVKLKIVSK